MRLANAHIRIVYSLYHVSVVPFSMNESKVEIMQGTRHLLLLVHKAAWLMQPRTPGNILADIYISVE